MEKHDSKAAQFMKPNNEFATLQLSVKYKIKGKNYNEIKVKTKYGNFVFFKKIEVFSSI